MSRFFYLLKFQSISFKFFDVQQIMGFVYPDKKNLGLKTYADMFEIEFIEHRSDEDARVTLLILKHVAKEHNLTVHELLRKYHITPGSNSKSETVPCSNGTYTKKELNYLI